MLPFVSIAIYIYMHVRRVRRAAGMLGYSGCQASNCCGWGRLDATAHLRYVATEVTKIDAKSHPGVKKSNLPGKARARSGIGAIFC